MLNLTPQTLQALVSLAFQPYSLTSGAYECTPKASHPFMSL